MHLTQEEVSSYRADPITKKVFMKIGFMIEDLKEMMVDGVQDYDFTRGFVQGMRLAMNVEGDEADGNKDA